MRTCPRCGEENAERARFCSNCGEPLAEAEQRRRERKYATALFADLVGSTSLAESEDPEIVQSVVGRAFDRLTEEISRYEGLLEKFMGDAVLAVFGVPRAHEDDAERAVRAALEMQAVLSELNRGFAAEGRPQLAMRIGIESGEVLVDQDRVSGTRDRMLTGDAVNVAARLQGAAEPGHVFVGPATFAATKDVIEYRELPPLELKGKAERVPAWQVLRVRAKQRGERPQLGIEAGLVGRDEELAVLKQTLQRVSNEGRPALVTVVGPAGVGKSRLVRELERYVEGLPETFYWRRGRCLAYGNASYSAVADAVKAQCEILEDDPAEVAVHKVETAVEELFGDAAVAPQICALVGAGEAGSFSREELFDAWRRFAERMASRYPLTLVLEDIHWADTGLLDFIEHVADWAQGPILLVTLARPELFDARPSWGGGKRNATSIYLEPLSEPESESMLADLLPGAVPPELARTIAERSEGNPLYVEEIVRKLIDDGVLRATAASRWEVAKPVDDVELPRSIQALIAARIDVLPDDEKIVLQDASVVGRVFWAGAVATLADRGAGEVRDALGRLRVKELVVPIDPPSFSDELEFAFRHALIRDGAYDSLPKALRADKHVQVARWAERRAGDRAEENAALIATHELEALGYLDELGVTGADRDDLARDAYRWARAAGDREATLWLPLEAARWYRHALRLGAGIDAPAVERAPIGRALVRMSFGIEPSEVTVEACRTSIALCAEAGDDLGAGWSTAWLALALFLQGKEDDARRSADEAVVRLEPHGDTAELAEAVRIRGQFLWRLGELEAAEVDSRRAAGIAERVGAIEIRAAAVQDLAIELSFSGRTDEAMTTIEEAFRLAKEAGDRANLQRAYNNFAAQLASVATDLPRAKAIAEEGVEMARRIGGGGWLAWIEGSLGEIELLRGDLDAAEPLLRASLDDAQASGDEPLTAMRHVVLAAVRLQRGAFDEAAAELRAAESIGRERLDPQVVGLRIWVEAELALARGDGERAVALLWEAAETSGVVLADQDPQIPLDLIRMLVAQGDRERALHVRELLAEARSPFARACREAADGLIAGAEDPGSAVASLREAADALGALDIRIYEALALVDLGRAERLAGADPRPSFERARALLTECGAWHYVTAVEAELAG
jgi:class 3 adenylate cyclase/tetratricopeptide (TPR) repeat protein